MGRPFLDGLLATVEAALAAAAFAEEGEVEAAREILSHAAPRDPGPPGR